MQEQNPKPDPQADPASAPAADAAQAAAAAAAYEAMAADSTPSLEELLRAARLQAEEHHDAWLRARAEIDNTRRRAQEDIAKAHKFAVEKFAADLLPVKDTLEMALADQNPESLRAGLELTLKNLVAAFEKAALVEENPLGGKFDPHRHQAMATQESDQPANTVIQVYQKGYLLAERVLRPAMVVVAKG